MQTGLSLPLRVNKGGGAKKDADGDQLHKLIILALQEGDDSNPFQDLGLDPKMVFRINDDASKFDIEEEILRVLKPLSGRMKILDPGIVLNPVYEGGQPEAEMHVSFEYINLETGKSTEFSEPVRSLGLGV